ncbi:Orotate phosphoribosyltransferase [Lentibacillus sp. JNUCC-1]|uniref:orotate phosphoribosyltransferase n=1 Tax=Lentibacillus sp. JNUCC-1 TaxID=2654513 RepID=UPI0012E7FCF9|nr:orotate phosphoribosyltransferase [Lentibacillus sp. JNUCC-1]MUV40028.1 Orotate phosphoribosyltransferase [Lentibacillus sp. JNUCC-1]
MENRFELVKALLNIEAVQINPDHYFTWTSGLKSPIYCDNRLTMGHPDLRDKIAESFSLECKTFDFDPEVIAGCATAGIPHAAWLAGMLHLPMVYVRSKPKEHGKGNQIEGPITQGQRVVVIEDLISTGNSAIQSAKALQEAGANVLGVLAIFSYGLTQAKENFAEAGLTFKSLTNFDVLIELLENEGAIDVVQKDRLIDWRASL